MADGYLEGTALVTGKGSTTAGMLVVLGWVREADVATVLCTHYGLGVRPLVATGETVTIVEV